MTLAIAHRGDPIGHRENTLAAVAAALEAAADMVEIDVRLTADGRPVVLHDDTLLRLWGDPRPVATLGRAELADLAPDVPDLDAVLDLISDAGRQIMIDLPEPAAGPVAYDVAARRGLLDISLFAGATHPLRRHAADARIALSWERVEPPERTELEFLRPEFFNPYFQLLTAQVADDMHARGIGICVWTVDHPGDMAAVLAQGADAVITNRIATLVELLRS